jgi:hypothetical protein
LFREAYALLKTDRFSYVLFVIKFETSKEGRRWHRYPSVG